MSTNGGIAIQGCAYRLTALNADGSITLTPAAGKKVTATAGGTPAAVQTTAGASPVLWADG